MQSSLVYLTIQYLRGIETYFFFLQTEDPTMERPYTFKDFLLRPRRWGLGGQRSIMPWLLVFSEEDLATFQKSS